MCADAADNLVQPTRAGTLLVRAGLGPRFGWLAGVVVLDAARRPMQNAGQEKLTIWKHPSRTIGPPPIKPHSYCLRDAYESVSVFSPAGPGAHRSDV